MRRGLSRIGTEFGVKPSMLRVDHGRPVPGRSARDDPFALLGYRFSPRLADLPDQRFWAINPPETYGPLTTAARGRLDLNLITENWDDMLRAAGALITGHTRASDLLRVTQSGGTPSILGRAIAEYGRIAKTLPPAYSARLKPSRD